MKFGKKRSALSLRDFLRSLGNYRRFYRLPEDRRSIVFYSEGGQDWHHFKYIIRALLEMKRNVCYVTSGPDDEGLQLIEEHYAAFYIREGLQRIVFFQFLKVDCLVLTMIDLHVFELKRSISPVHYVYLFHAMGSTHMVDFENSYDHYDTILCVGPHQIAEIRARERLKNLPPKNLVEHGYARVEQLMFEAESRRRVPARPYTVLIAPTWGENSILHICGSELVGVLLRAGFRVILRPHYQTVRLAPRVVDAVLAEYGKYPGFSYIGKMGETQSLFDSDILICDWSSTSIEYALGLEKPVLYIDVPRRVRNPKYRELGLEPIEASVRTEVGKVLAPTELEKAPEMIDSLLVNHDDIRRRIVQFRNKNLFNIGRSVEAGATAIAATADSVKAKRTAAE